MAIAESPLALTADGFGQLANPYRRELLIHCYRMLGSVDDAEDAVQDTYVRAWHGRNTFQSQVSFRAWLYRIATNACLDAIERRKRSHSDAARLGVEPFATDVREDSEAGPEARYAARESVSLAFLTALQVLPARQRAVLILRDVLAWRAAESAELLELTVPAVNSALHRARTTLSRHYTHPARADTQRHMGNEPGHLRSLLDRYVRAWEQADVAGLVALLRDDAVLSMPPDAAVSGAHEIADFVARSLFNAGTRLRLVPINGNGLPGFVVFRGDGGAPLRALAVLLLDVRGERIGRINAFFDERSVARFAPTPELPA